MYIKKKLKNTIEHFFKGYVRGSFSQQKQDRWISDIVFGGLNKGFFVEIGAHDGISISNTYYLEKFKEWEGILVEPNPNLFKDIKRVRSVEALNCAVSDKVEEIEFIPDGALGRISKGRGKCTIKTECYTLKEILNRTESPSKIEYLSVDVEGHEDSVFAQFPIEGYEIMAITVETPSKKLRNKIVNNGYKKILEIPGIDCLYVKNEIEKSIQKNFTKENWSYFEFKINSLIEKL